MGKITRNIKVHILGNKKKRKSENVKQKNKKIENMISKEK